jgi:hypothetical protein
LKYKNNFFEVDELIVLGIHEIMVFYIGYDTDTCEFSITSSIKGDKIKNSENSRNMDEIAQIFSESVVRFRFIE